MTYWEYFRVYKRYFYVILGMLGTLWHTFCLRVLLGKCDILKVLLGLLGVLWYFLGVLYGILGVL